MSHPYEPLKSLRPTNRPTAGNYEANYWKAFEKSIVIKHQGPVQKISFETDSPHNFAIAQAARIIIYSSRTLDVVRTIARFKDIVQCLSIRSDNKVIAAADTSGLIQVFDMHSRSILCTIPFHKTAVHSIAFSPHRKTLLASASDEPRIAIWDISSGENLGSWTGHTDYIRCITFHSKNPNLLFSGSYDHWIKLWNIENQELVLSFNHKAQVEEFKLIRDSVLVSVGGLYLKAWDIVSGSAKPIVSMKATGQDLTCVTVTADHDRVISGSVDGQIRIIETETWSLVHIIKYASPIMSLAFSPDSSAFVIGTADGDLILRRKESTTPRPTLPNTKPKAFKYMMRGDKTNAVKDDIVVEAERRKQIKPFDKLLLKFRYGDALDLALETKNILTVTSLLYELLHRSGLRQALQNRDQYSLEPLLQLILKYISYSAYSNVLFETLFLLMDIYDASLAKTKYFKILLHHLHQKVNHEIDSCYETARILGMMQLLTG